MVSKPRSIKRAIPVLGLALIASLALAAFASVGSASAAVQHWYSCKNVGAGAGVYENSSCAKEGGSKAFAWSQLTTPTGFALNGVAGATKVTGFATNPPFILNGLWAAVEVQIACSSVTSKNGTAQNPGGAATGSLELVASGCQVPKPIGGGCKVPGGQLQTGGLKMTATEGPGVEFRPAVGNEIVSIHLSGCKASYLNQIKSVVGSFTGSGDGTSLVVNKATSSLETAEGMSTWLELSSRLETNAGEALKLAP